MKSFFRILAKGLAGFFAVLFVMTALLSLVLVPLGSRLFNPNLYKRALQDQGAYDSLPGILGDMLISSGTYDPCDKNPLVCEDISPALLACYQSAIPAERYATLASGEAEPDAAEQILIQNCLAQYGSPAGVQPSTEGGMPSYFRNLSSADWQNILSILLPQDELQVMVESLLDDTFAYLKGDLDRVTVSLVTLKQRLAGEAGDELIRELITSQPACTDELLSLITGVIFVNDLTLCKPPELLLPLAIATTHLVMDQAIAIIPDEVVILPPKGDESGVEDAMLAVRWARWIMFLSPLLPLLFLGLVALFAVRSLKGWLRWWGIPLTIAGGIGLLGSLNMLLLWHLAWEKWLTPGFPTYLGESLLPLAQGLAGFIIRDLALWIGLGGVLLLLVGLAMWILARFVKQSG